MTPVDWLPLPNKFRHLIPFFEEYGSLQFENKVDHKLKTIQEAELIEVRRVYKLLLPDGDELDGWIDDIGLTQSRAAARVYFTLLFLDIAKDRGLLS